MPDPTPQASTATAPLPVVDRFLQQGKIIRDDSQRQFALTLLSEYATQVLEQGMTVGKDSVVAGIKARIAQIDEGITAQLNEVMHSPEFQKMEASWRGLHYLVMNTETSAQLKLRVLNIPKKELFRDLRAIGYRGMLSLELFNRDYWKQDALTVAKTGLEKMRVLVKASAS